jgi:TRAP-type uncharacterized transport system substrate-binding protein
MPVLEEGRSRIGRGTRLAIILIVVALVAALLWAVLTIGNPFPPRTLVMATGPAGSAFDEFGARYRAILKRSGVDVQLIQTAGGVDNLARLRDPSSGVTVALVENGLTDPKESPGLVSLGTVSLEPLWIFSRRQANITGVQSLKGKRISIEPVGSGARVMAAKFLALNDIDETNAELLGLSPEQSAEALRNGNIETAMILTSWESPLLRQLLVDDAVVLNHQPRADAYVALFPNLIKVVLPMGVADLAKNIPPNDVTMLAVETSLVVHRDIHAGLQYLLLQAAEEIHGGPGVFHAAGRFPAAEAFDLPLSDQARAFYKSDRPFVYRYLPFWMAALAERLLIVLIPLFTIVFPLVQLLPRLYAYLIQNRIFGLYGQLKFLETRLSALGPDDSVDDVALELARLSKQAENLHVPLGYAQRLYTVRSHIALTQQEIERRRARL